MTSSTILPVVEYDPPVISPAPYGLFPVVSWTDEGDAPHRWLGGGVRVRTINYGGLVNTGVWDQPWCGDPTDPDANKLPVGRPEFLDAFDPVTTWGSDQCMMRDSIQAEVRVNATRWMALYEPIRVGRAFAARMLDDAGTPDTAVDIVAAVAACEAKIAESGALGFIHLSPIWAASLAQAQLVRASGSTLKTILGNTYVFDGGYVAGLGDTLVATSPVYGWRGAVKQYEYVTVAANNFIAISERSVVLGYEDAITAVTVT